MELNELEFTAEDFDKICSDHYETNGLQPYLAELTNRLLRERLAKAPEVRSDSIGRTAEWLHAERGLYATHRARLVCIEEIGEGVK